MTHAGLPWRADVHDRLLTDLLGPRPAPGLRPAVLERLAAEIRDAFARTRPEPRFARPSCCARSRRRGCR